MTEEKFSAADEELIRATAFIDGVMENAGVPFKIMMQVDTAFEEIFVNIAHYAYEGKDGWMLIRAGAEDGCLTIRFTDGGVPFDPLKKDDPDISLGSEERKIGGLGIFMVKKMMDAVEYEYSNGCNILTITKKFEKI